MGLCEVQGARGRSFGWGDSDRAQSAGLVRRHGRVDAIGEIARRFTDPGFEEVAASQNRCEVSAFQLIAVAHGAALGRQGFSACALRLAVDAPAAVVAASCEPPGAARTPAARRTALARSLVGQKSGNFVKTSPPAGRPPAAGFTFLCSSGGPPVAILKTP